jgi:hypothetical protein
MEISDLHCLTASACAVDNIDTLIRGAAIGLFVLLAVLDWRARPNSAFAWTGVLYAGGVVAYLLAGEDAIPAWPPLLRLAIGLTAAAAPLFFWAHARLLFDDIGSLPAEAMIVVSGLVHVITASGVGSGAQKPCYGFLLAWATGGPGATCSGLTASAALESGQGVDLCP